jgi:hypothetical protein
MQSAAPWLTELPLTLQQEAKREDIQTVAVPKRKSLVSGSHVAALITTAGDEPDICPF